MKTFLRAGFGLLLILGVGLQVHWLRQPYPAADTQLGLLQPLAGLRLTTFVSNDSEVVSAIAVGCAAPVAVALLDLNGGEDARADAMLGPGRAALYVYLGSTGQRPARLGLYGRWLGANAAAMLGLRPTRAPSHMVLVALPNACPWLGALDWAKLSPRT